MRSAPKPRELPTVYLRVFETEVCPNLPVSSIDTHCYRSPPSTLPHPKGSSCDPHGLTSLTSTRLTAKRPPGSFWTVHGGSSLALSARSQGLRHSRMTHLQRGTSSSYPLWRYVGSLPPNPFFSTFIYFDWQAIITNMLVLPSSQHKQIYYCTLVTEICKLSAATCGPAVGKSIRKLYSLLNDGLDVEVARRFSEWFSIHMSNFGYQWVWNEWYASGWSRFPVFSMGDSRSHLGAPFPPTGRRTWSSTRTTRDGRSCAGHWIWRSGWDTMTGSSRRCPRGCKSPRRL